MPLREILYLDRDRVDSYISQLAGGVIVRESLQSTDAEKLSGKVKASIKVVEFEVGGEKSTGSTTALTRIPAHAILSTLEQLLESSAMLVDVNAEGILPGQLGRVPGRASENLCFLTSSCSPSPKEKATTWQCSMDRRSRTRSSKNC